MAGFALLLAAVGTAVSAVGSYRQGQTQQMMANYNAKVAEMKGKAEFAKASMEAEARYAEGTKLAKQAQAGFAKSGGGIGGSAADTVANLYSMGVLNSANTAKMGEDAQAMAYSGAEATRTAGRAAYNAGVINAGSSLLSGASKIMAAGMGDSVMASALPSAQPPNYRYG